MMQRRLLVSAALSAFIFLAGCANTAKQLTASNNDNYWSGRISVQVLDTPPQSTSGSFELSGSPDSGEMVLLNPLGYIVARVQWAPGQATLTQGQQKKHAPSLDALTQELVGTPLPIAVLFDWLRGTPTQASGWSADLNTQGKVTAQRTSPLPAANLRIVLDSTR